MARITVTRGDTNHELLAVGLPLRSGREGAEGVPCRENKKLACAHDNAPGFWRWFNTVHEHRAVALRSGLVDEVIVEWPEA